MRSVLWLAGAAAVALGCSNAVAPTTDVESSRTHALVTIERTELADSLANPRAAAIAQFVRLPAYTDADTVLELSGVARTVPDFDTCVAPAPDSSVPLAGVGSIEFLPVGDVVVETSGRRTALAPHAFPAVTDIFSGVVYASRDRSEPLAAGTRYSVRASGAEGIAPLEVAANAPRPLEDVAVDGVALSEARALALDEPVEVTWRSGAATDSVVVELSSLEGARVLCGFPDERGAGLLPTDLELEGETRLSVHRIRSVDFDGLGIESGELRFDFEVATNVDVLR